MSGVFDKVSVYPQRVPMMPHHNIHGIELYVRTLLRTFIARAKHADRERQNREADEGK